MTPAEDFFWTRLSAHGAAPALVMPSGDMVTYAELAARADAFGAQLPAERQLVGLQAANEVESVVAYLACLRGRHPVILLNESSLADGRIASAFRPNFVYSKATDGAWVLDRLEDEPPAFNEDLAVLLSTSGSTGSPKLVKLSRGNIDSNAASIVEYLEIDARQRAVTTLNFAYSYGLSVLNSHLCAGARLLLTSDSIIAQSFWDFFKKQGGTSLAFVPHHFELLDQIGFSKMALPTLSYVTQAGGRLAPERVKHYAAIGRAMGWRLFVMYGQTEAAPRISYIPPADIMQNADSIGLAIPGGDIFLLDENGERITQRRQTGELVYKGPNVMIGYAEARADLAKPKDTDLLHTGDMAQINYSGYFKIVGRMKRFIKLYGLRINLDDVEQFLEQRGHAGYCAGTDEKLAVFFETPVHEGAIRGLLADKYNIHPSNIQVAQLQEIPRLLNGKVDYKRLAELSDEAPAPSPAAVSADSTLQQAFASELGSAVKPTDSFVSIGGDSLSYLNLSMAIEARLGYLPRNWERTPLQDLEKLQPSRSGMIGISMETLIRVCAILSVVCRHSTGWETVGGAIALMFLSGYSFAKTQTERLASGNILRALGLSLGRIMVIYYLVLTTYFMLRPDHIASAGPAWYLLFANFLPLDNSLYPYWFICAYVQIIALWALAWAAPGVRARFAGKPLSYGYWALAVGIAAAAIVNVMVPDFDSFQYNTFAIFYLFALGWCVLFSETRPRKALVSVIALLTAWLFWFGKDQGHGAVIAVASLALIWIDEIKLPRPIAWAMNWISARSFYIYVLHIAPLLVFQKLLTGPGALVPIAILVATTAASIVLAGFASWALARVNEIARGDRGGARFDDALGRLQT